MPAYDPNSFSDGISKDDWAMLSGHDHLPLMNKVLHALYPSGSTVKPMIALALLNAGIKPEMTVTCTGSYRVGNAIFHCDKVHGTLSMERAIAQSCDIYFYHCGRMVGIDAIAPYLRELGLGQKFDLPFNSQRYGTVPDSAWLQRRYHRKWTVADTVNASIGQGYVLVNPLQLAVAATRLASGKRIEPRLIMNKRYGPQGDDIDVRPEHLEFVRQAMGQVVTSGTAAMSKLQIPGVAMAGKTGTAQVRRITMAERSVGVRTNESLPWRFRDHALFIGFAPVENPRYAAAVVIEHGGFGASIAAPIVRDTFTYLFDQDKANATLATLEEKWGGDINARMAAEAGRWQAAKAAAAAAAVDPDNGTAANAPQSAATAARTEPAQPKPVPAAE
jgi:penicillin-binding protein 2